jgi:hypothetical protein
MADALKFTLVELPGVERICSAAISRVATVQAI